MNIEVGFDILNSDSGKRTIGPCIGDPGVGDDVVDKRYVVLGLEETDGCSSIEVHGIINLQDDEGTR